MPTQFLEIMKLVDLHLCWLLIVIDTQDDTEIL